MLDCLPPGRSRARLARRHASRRGILLNGLHYRSPALEEALSSSPTRPVSILVDPANLQTIKVILQESSTELIVPVVSLAQMLKQPSPSVAKHGVAVGSMGAGNTVPAPVASLRTYLPISPPRGLRTPASSVSAIHPAVAAGRLDQQVEEAIREACMQTFTSSRPQTLRSAYEMLSARLGAVGLKRPSYSTFLRRARRWAMSNS